MKVLMPSALLSYTRAPQLQAEGDTLDASDGAPHLGLWRLLVCNLLGVGTQAMPRPGR